MLDVHVCVCKPKCIPNKRAEEKKQSKRDIYVEIYITNNRKQLKT